MKRNEFVKNASLATAAFAIQPNIDIFSRSASTPIKLGVIGVGQRGRGHLKNLLLRNDVEIVAISDIDSRCINLANELFKTKGKAIPENFLGDELNWKKMVEKDIHIWKFTNH